MQLANLTKPNASAPIKWFEPKPNRFFAPFDLYQEWQQTQGFPGEYLGNLIKSPGGVYTYQVHSGPCCRLYAGNERLEPHSFERGWMPKDEAAYTRDPVGYGKKRENWRRVSACYLSYLVSLVPTAEEKEPSPIYVELMRKSTPELASSLLHPNKVYTYVTVRWESPTSKDVKLSKVCTLVCPLKEPLSTSAAQTAA